MELILSNHPFECLTCRKNGQCELQNVASELGIRVIRYPGEKSTFSPDVSPAIVRDLDKCIMCRRCETMCNSVQSVGAISAINRGFNSIISTRFWRRYRVRQLYLLRTMCGYLSCWGVRR